MEELLSELKSLEARARHLADSGNDPNAYAIDDILVAIRVLPADKLRALGAHARRLALDEVSKRY